MPTADLAPVTDWLAPRELRRLRGTLETLIDELGVSATKELMTLIVTVLAMDLQEPIHAMQPVDDDSRLPQPLALDVLRAVIHPSHSGSSCSIDLALNGPGPEEELWERALIQKGLAAYAAVRKANGRRKRPRRVNKSKSKGWPGWQVKTRANNGLWYIEFDGADGKRVRISLKTRSEEQAHVRAEQVYLAYWQRQQSETTQGCNAQNEKP